MDRHRRQPRIGIKTLSRKRAVKLAWLAGILDGDGTICVNAEGRVAVGWSVRKYPLIAIGICNILNAEGIAYTVSFDEASGKIVIRVQRRDDVLKLLGRLYHFLRGKKTQAMLAIRILRSPPRSAERGAYKRALKAANNKRSKERLRKVAMYLKERVKAEPWKKQKGDKPNQKDRWWEEVKGCGLA